MAAEVTRSGSNNPAWKGGRPKVTKGYTLIYMPGHARAKKNFVYEHIVIAEKAPGRPLPLTHPVHHFNEIKSDNRNQNLVICENNAYHKLLHARQHIVELGGDPNVVKKCGVCKTLIALTEFHSNCAMPDGLNQNCKACQRRLANKRYERKIGGKWTQPTRKRFCEA